MSSIVKINISTIFCFVYVLAMSADMTSSASSAGSKVLSKPLKQYLLTRITQEKTKQLEDTLRQYSKTLSILKKVNLVSKRDWLDEFVSPRGFGDFKHSDWNRDEEAVLEETAEYDSIGGGWWADEPFLDLNELSMETRDESKQADKFNDERHAAAASPAFQAPGQFGGQFSAGGTVQEGLEHDDGWGKFLWKRTYKMAEKKA